MAVMAVLVIAASGFAQSACPSSLVADVPPNDFIGEKGTGGSLLKIAVASNYYCPAVDMVHYFLQSASSGTNLMVKVHHGSTGTLIAELESNSIAYDFLFTADEISQTFVNNINFANYTNSNVLEEEVAAFLYAKGVPSFFGYKADGITNVGKLIVGLGSADNFVVDEYGEDLADMDYEVNSMAEAVAVAVTPAAPYGTAAAAIFSEFTSWPSISGPWNNIATTYDKVGTAGVKSGVVSKAQICNNIKAGQVSHVDFTGYTLNQEAVQITGNGQPLMDWILGEMVEGENDTNSAWNDFLDNHCYGLLTP